MRARGDFALSWAAHDLHYGIPATIDADLASGKQVVINVSRAVIDAERAKYPGLLVVLITATPETLRRRMTASGRETPAAIEERLDRAADFTLAGPDVAVLNNASALAAGVH